jgi:hypothetical protein
MAIWGHTKVIVEKDKANKRWIVRTLSGAELVVVPWTAAFADFPFAPDYAEAVSTCQADPDMRLTPREKEEVLRLKNNQPVVEEDAEDSNVLKVDFQKKKRLT